MKVSKQTLNEALLSLKKAAPTILTILSAGGVIVTAWLSSEAAVKAAELIKTEKESTDEELTKKDVVKLCWKTYIPTAVAAGATIALQIGANTMGTARISALAGAVTATNSMYKAYQEKTKELFGIDTHNRIMHELEIENFKDSPAPYCPGAIGPDGTLDFNDPYEPVQLFYDAYSDRYFESTFSRVLQAEYHLNRNYTLGGATPINEFYEFLGINEINGGDDLGWWAYDGLAWIDFNHVRLSIPDDIDCANGHKYYYRIEMVFYPEYYDAKY